jgi:hypothetical protein
MSTKRTVSKLVFGGSLLAAVGFVAYSQTGSTQISVDVAAEFEGILNDASADVHSECVCSDGFRPNEAGDECINIDDCETGNNICTDGTCRDLPPPAPDYACDCDAGYDNTITPYDCEPVPCDPITIPHSNIDGCVANPGETHAALCDDGYGETPDFLLECVGIQPGESGWENDLPCDAVDCPVLTVDHSTTTAFEGKTTATTTITCDFGYAQVHSVGATVCEYNAECKGTAPGVSEWFTTTGAEEFECTAAECPPLSHDYATFEGDSNIFHTDESVDMVCHAGYALANGDHEWTTNCVGVAPCTSDWDTGIDCEPVFCPPLSLENSIVEDVDTARRTDEEAFEVQCSSGYQPSTGLNEACTIPFYCVGDVPGFAMWSWEGQCERVVCPAFAVAHTQDYQQTIYDDDLQEVLTTCADGYASGGAGTHLSRCLPDGPCEAEWDTLPNCECVSCPELHVSNSDTSGQTSCTDLTETVNCNAGFCASGSGSFEAECTGFAPAISYWEHDTCEPVACPTLTIANSNINAIVAVTGEEYHVQCEDGYENEDFCTSWMVMCIPEGPCEVSWQHAEKTCSPVSVSVVE